MILQPDLPAQYSSLLKCCMGHVAYRFVKATVIEQVNPFEGRIFHSVQSAQRPAMVDYLRNISHLELIGTFGMDPLWTRSSPIEIMYLVGELGSSFSTTFTVIETLDRAVEPYKV